MKYIKKTKLNIRISKYISEIVHHWYQQMQKKTSAHETADNIMLNDRTGDYNLIVNA